MPTVLKFGSLEPTSFLRDIVNFETRLALNVPTQSAGIAPGCMYLAVIIPFLKER